MLILLYIVVVPLSIFIGYVLSKEYTLLKNYKKREEDLNDLHSQIKELKDEIIKPIQNNSNPNQKHEQPSPTIILDDKIYSQQEFSKEINSGKIQMSSMLQSQLYKQDKK